MGLAMLRQSPENTGHHHREIFTKIKHHVHDGYDLNGEKNDQMWDRQNGHAGRPTCLVTWGAFSACTGGAETWAGSSLHGQKGPP